MGIIKEPEGIDFMIQSRPLTVDEQKEISEFIKMRKSQNTGKNTVAIRNKINSKKKLKSK